MKAVICPVCEGKGIYYGLLDSMTSASRKKYICHGCGGKGWVEVHDEQPTYPQYEVPPNTCGVGGSI